MQLCVDGDYFKTPPCHIDCPAYTRAQFYWEFERILREAGWA
jgi:hypothetical protein